MSLPPTAGPYPSGPHHPGRPGSAPGGNVYLSAGPPPYSPGGYGPQSGGYGQGGGYGGGRPQGGYPQGGHPQGGYNPGYSSGRSGGGGQWEPPSRPSGPHPAEDLPLAPLGRRAAARALETGLLWVIGVAVIVPFVLAIIGSRPENAKTGVSTSTYYFVFFIVLAVIPFFYEWSQLAFRGGQTLGKAYFGLRVVQADPPGEPISPLTAAKRAAVNNAGYWIACGIGVLVGYLWALWDRPLYQGLNDKLAGTVVIDDRVEYEEDSPDDQATGVYGTYPE